MEIKKSIYIGVRKEKNFFYAVLAGKIVAKCQTEVQAAACYNVAATVKYGIQANTNLDLGLTYTEIPSNFEPICRPKGVTRSGKYAAKYKKKHLGTFASEAEARIAIEIERLRSESIPFHIKRNPDGVAILTCSESFVMVDDDIYLRFHKKKLAIDFAGYPRTGMTLLHRVVMGATKGQIVDHKWHNLLDARRQSLRFVTRSQNGQNRIKKEGATSQYFGVSKKKKDRLWLAQVRTSAQERVRMYFQTEIEAAKWYDSKVVNYYGPNARKDFSDL